MTYTLARTMMWLIPILGFIGTVQGLGSAVGGFADFLKGAAELTAIKGAIANVTIGLGVAFDTTFLALMLVTFVQFPLTSIMRREATLLAEIDIYLDEHFISRLPSAEQQAGRDREPRGFDRSRLPPLHPRSGPLRGGLHGLDRKGGRRRWRRSSRN